MNHSLSAKHAPRAKVYGKLTKNYIPFEEIDPNKNYNGNDFAQFQRCFLFGIIHQN